MSRVFIAHAEADKEKAVWIRDFLKAAGLDPWTADDILPGEKTELKTRQAINESDFFLALFSKKSLSEKGDFHRQLGYALNKSGKIPEGDIFVIPILLDACRVENEFLKEREPLDLFLYPEQGLEKLFRVLSQKTEAEDDGNSPSPFSQISPESIRELAKRLRKKPGLRKRIVFWTCLCVIMIVAGLRFEGVLHFHDKQTDAHMASATRFLNQGMYGDALAEYDRALKFCHDCPKILRDRQKAELFKEVAKAEANPGILVARLENMPGISKDDPHILMLRANMKARMEDEETAETLYLKAVKSEPDLAEAWFGLSVLYHKQRKNGNALEMIQNAVSIAESNYKYKDMLAWMYFETGQSDLAIQTYENLLSDADFLLVYLEIAKVLVMNGDKDAALAYLETLAEKIENDEIAGLPANTGPWYFPTDGDPAVLDSLAAKRYYAWFSLAATRYVFDPASDAETAMQTFMQKAGALEIGPSYARQIRMLVDWDISEIVRKYGNDPSVRERAGEFRDRFLSKKSDFSYCSVIFQMKGECCALRGGGEIPDAGTCVPNTDEIVPQSVKSVSKFFLFPACPAWAI